MRQWAARGFQAHHTDQPCRRLERLVEAANSVFLKRLKHTSRMCICYVSWIIGRPNVGSCSLLIILNCLLLVCYHCYFLNTDDYMHNMPVLQLRVLNLIPHQAWLMGAYSSSLSSTQCNKCTQLHPQPFIQDERPVPSIAYAFGQKKSLVT